jgi:hypothetical protein
MKIGVFCGVPVLRFGLQAVILGGFYGWLCCASFDTSGAKKPAQLRAGF